jgi:hypothetical protein
MKHVSTRIIHKHALEADWLKATNFAPLQGELIIYDIEVDKNGNAIKIPDGDGGEIEAYTFAAQYPSRTAYKDQPYTYERFKIGDGKTNVNDLPFAAYIPSATSTTLGGVRLILDGTTLTIETDEE